jgi:hypothetical protein
VAVTSLNDVKPERRAATIQKWTDGVLLATDGILQNCKGLETYLKPDVLVVDEAHTMIRNPRNKGFLMLKSIAPRRIIGKTV